MLRSLYSGVSGMKSFQTKMDVIANNIANVNTTAFKSSRVRFQDMLSQTLSSAQGAGDNLGGVNPRQVGLGVKVGSIDAMMENGALQPTNRELDFAIEGNGFFVVASKFDGGAPIEVLYTRDGGFFRDSAGNVVNSNGEKVLGYLAEDLEDFDADTEITFDMLKPLIIPETDPDNEDRDLQSYTIDGTGTITAVYADGTGAESKVLGRLAIATFSTPEGLEKRGNNNYSSSNNSGSPVYGSAGDAGFGVVRQGFLEMSNVDLANEFTEMVIASRAYSANSRSITTSDEMLQELINLKR
ncbi:flagellar hook-basal body complex protein [Gudongella oleilytica]|uniref:flagellar hook-basal body complex protein n=1 Tax=Gudongella oleilytica TaxID=1582259 RepID=UPI002A361087|nr:flagellar hook-basal body complex protein [Gudongella oleilytica]MDY0256562.1 flagellar hook-basal body complex protein [Gudongella oleilytica]HMM68979.1 flagellar hook-basal body complex protein [Gudongella oleilytica]